MARHRPVRSFSAALYVVVVAIIAQVAGPAIPQAQASVVNGPTVIGHVPVTTAYVGNDIAVDASTVCAAASTCPLDLVFRTTGGGTGPIGAWQRLPMDPVGQQTVPDDQVKYDWSTTIPGWAVDSTGVDYYVESVGSNGTVSSPVGVATTGASYHVTALAPPAIQHVPTPVAFDNTPIPIEMRSTCSTPTCEASLYYRTTPSGDPQVSVEVQTEIPDWPHVTMQATASTSLGEFGREITYRADIPAQYVETRGVDYLIVVQDGSARAVWPGTSYQGNLQADGIRTGHMHVHVAETPHVDHVPVATAPFGQDIAVSGQANCPAERTCQGTLYWRTTDPSSGSLTTTKSDYYESAGMTVTDAGPSTVAGQRLISVTGVIPASFADTRGVDYFFSVTDGSTTTWWPGTSRIETTGVYVDGLSVLPFHTRVLEPPHIVPGGEIVAPADKPLEISMLANCATDTCTAKLHFAPHTPLSNEEVSRFRELDMAPTGAPVSTPAGPMAKYIATIPARFVTTYGLVYWVDVFDGYTHTYAPGTSYEGAWVPSDGQRTPDVSDLEFQGAVGVDANVDGLPRRVNTFPVRVLEPPHVAHVPTAVAAKGVPLDIQASTLCAYSRCDARVDWFDASGRQDTTTLAGVSDPASAGSVNGLTPWTFSGTLPDTATDGDTLSYRISITDGFATESTPTYPVQLRDEFSVGVIKGHLWYEVDGDGVLEPGEPAAPGARVQALVSVAGQLGLPTTQTVAETSTDVAGRYVFRNLPVGSYTIKVLQSPPGGQPFAGNSKSVQLGLTKATVDFSYRPLDSDGDGIPDAVELRAGLSPTGGADTDHDGLTDAVEISHFSGTLRPDIADSDGDGIGDRDDDADSDGLTNKQEIDSGTNPLDADEDQDGLIDPTELSRGTDPAVADTDSDGLPDGFEPKVGTDPLAPDTDGDTVLDGDEVFTSTATATGATVSVTGTGPLADNVTIRVEDPDATPAPGPGLIGDIREIHLDSRYMDGFDSADITLPYDPAQVADPSHLEVFAFNDDVGMWMPAGAASQVSAQDHTVTTTVNHFSLYALFDRGEWDATFSGHAAPQKPIEVVLTIDSSGSMLDTDPQDLRKQASLDLVNDLPAYDQAAVVDFDQYATLRAALGSPKDQLRAGIDAIDSDGGTDLGAGVGAALDELDAHGNRTHDQIVLFVTDGIGPYDATLTDRAIAAGVKIFAIDLGGANAALLQDVAQRTGGKYYNLDQASGFAGAFADAEKLSARGDEDGDGLPNAVEEQGLLSTTTGELIQTDPRDPDSDHDGLYDGDEVKIVDLRNVSYFDGVPPAIAEQSFAYQVSSDPNEPDTDSDHLDDYDEADFGSSPLRPDTDGDKLWDFLEADYNTEPDNPDTDYDGRSDFTEQLTTAPGYDPRALEVTMSKKAYLNDFGCGVVVGGFNEIWPGCDDTTLAWLGGSVVSGFVVWGDIRDFVYSAIHGDIIGAGLSVIGLVPAYGDAVKAGTDIGNYLKRVVFTSSGFSALAGASVTGVSGSFDEALETGALGVSKGVSSTGVDVAKALSKADPEDLAFLRGVGMKDNVTAAILQSGRSSRKLRALLEDTKNAPNGSIVTNDSGFLNDWHLGEDQLRAGRNGGEPHARKVTADAETRIIDYLLKTIGYESKVGQQAKSQRILAELKKDCRLIEKKALTGVEWHFFGSYTPGGKYRLGPTGPLLDELIRYSTDPDLKKRCPGITFVIHVPTSNVVLE